MALSLKSVDALRGARWVADAWRLFTKKPLAFMALSAVFVLLSVVVQLLPPLGLVVIMLPPLLGLGFMIASQSALLDGPVHPRQFIEPLRTDTRRRRALLMLCGLYGVAVLAIVLLAFFLSGTSLEDLQAPAAAASGATGASAPATAPGTGAPRQPTEIDLSAPGAFTGVLLALGLVAALSVPFWHAPALVHWGGQSVAQALFSSTLAVWRCRGAFLVYGLSIAGLVLLTLATVSLAAGLIGSPSLAALLAVPASLAMTSVFYISVLFSFNDSFGGKAVPPMDDDYTRPDPG